MRPVCTGHTLTHTLHTIITLMCVYLCVCSRLNLRELGPWGCHMRWLVWVMATVGTTYVFFFHERSGVRHTHFSLLI